ncbi:hypothetical protein CAC42_3671 [Sphaceloma murrayae]|uniref:Ubiquitin-like protease family profile domain-containing protein n=1 Tax=Sphaceloma murrayae TaxID=2082308 RepID=A0A2K1QPZ9_9PEZI|nr:hypothetical protein CAC42_3671 [Sphaceloma murrayae]
MDSRSNAHFGTEWARRCIIEILPSPLRESIATIESDAGRTEGLISKYHSIHRAILDLQTFPHQYRHDPDVVFSESTRALIGKQLKLYDQAKPIQKDLADGPWNLGREAFQQRFGDEAFHSLKFLRSMREFAKLVPDIEQASRMIARERDLRVGRPKPIRGVARTISFKPRDVELAIAATKRLQSRVPIAEAADVPSSPTPVAEQSAPLHQACSSESPRLTLVDPAKIAPTQSIVSLYMQVAGPHESVAAKRKVSNSSCHARIRPSKRRRQSSAHKLDVVSTNRKLFSQRDVVKNEDPEDSAVSIELGRTADPHSALLSDEWDNDSIDDILPGSDSDASPDAHYDDIPTTPSPAVDDKAAIGVVDLAELSTPASISLEREEAARLTRKPEASGEQIRDAFEPKELLNDDDIYGTLLAMSPSARNYRVIHPAAISTAVGDRTGPRHRSRVLRNPKPKVLVLPMHWTTPLHWSLAVMDLSTITITHFDSLASPQRNSDARRALLRFAVDIGLGEIETWRYNNAVVCQQDNPYDCGILAIANGLSIMHELILPDEVDTGLVRKVFRRLYSSEDQTGIVNNAIDVVSEDQNESALSAVQEDDSPETKRYEAYMSRVSRKEITSCKKTLATAVWLRTVIASFSHLVSTMQDLSELQKSRDEFFAKLGSEDAIVTAMDQRLAELRLLTRELQDGPRALTFPISSVRTIIKDLGTIITIERRRRERQNQEEQEMQKEKQRLLDSMQEEQQALRVRMERRARQIEQLEGV